MYTKPRRRMRTIGVASAIFAGGAALGWNFAGLIFATQVPVPTVAAVRFEDSRQDAIPSTRRFEAALPTSPTATNTEDRRSYQPDMAVRPSDEERRLAEALQWAERYRQRQDASVQGVIVRQVQQEKMRLAAAEAQRWAEVAEQAKRIKQPPAEFGQLIAAQGEQHGARGGIRGSRIASAAGGMVGGMASAKAEPAATRARFSRCENCGYRSSRKHARVAKRNRAARHARAHRAGYESGVFMCPLRWLEAALMGDGHRGRRYVRRHAWLG
jgi:hypothetical protein